MIFGKLMKSGPYISLLVTALHPSDTEKDHLPAMQRSLAILWLLDSMWVFVNAKR